MDNPRAESTDLSDIGHNGGAGSFKNRTIGLWEQTCRIRGRKERIVSSSSSSSSRSSSICEDTTADRRTHKYTDTQTRSSRYSAALGRSLGVFSVILLILPPVFSASFLHPLSPLGFLNSFLKSILVPSAIVLLYNMVLTTTSKPTFLPWPLFDYLSLLPAILYDHMNMYVGLFGHSVVVFHVFMFY